MRACTQWSSRQTELARIAGAVAPLCFTLTGEVFYTAWRGDLATAAALAAEVNALTDAIGIRQAPYRYSLARRPFRGNKPRSSTFIEAAIDLARSPGREVGCPGRALGERRPLNRLARYEQALSFSLQASEETPEILHRSLGAPRDNRGGGQDW